MLKANDPEGNMVPQELKESREMVNSWVPRKDYLYFLLDFH